MGKPFRVLLLNQISPSGLERLPSDRYELGKSIREPDAILVRSHDMHSIEIPRSVRAIGRAGAGTNNIPVAAMSARGVPVFNAPGANANAVKELVLTGMLMAARNAVGAIKFVEGLESHAPNLEELIEQKKSSFAGFELMGKSVGIIGLGKIGCMVADMAIKLGMTVIGYDPDITVDAAWSLPSQVKRASTVTDVLRNCDFVTLHVPLFESTRHLIGHSNLGEFRDGAVLLNFSRDGVVDQEAVLDGIASGKLRYYVCDFPSSKLIGQKHVIALPHLGASTREAEDNCARMVADQIRDFLENGDVINSVNFPNVAMPRESNFRVAIANSNVPNMVGQISSAMASANLNIHNMINKSRGDMAYSLVDVDSPVPETVTESISRIHGVLAVHYLAR